MIGLAIVAALVKTAAPHFGEITTNTRLRSVGSLLHSEALLAQSEAIKRSRTVRLTIDAGAVVMQDMGDPANPVELRRRTMLPGASAAITTTTTGITTLDFGSEGRPVTFGTAVSVDVSMTGVTCSGDLRCPGLRVDAGGAINLCGDRTNCS